MKAQEAIASIEKDYLKAEETSFKVGDTVKVMQKIAEGEKTRLQAFEGVVVSKRGKGIKMTFSVLRQSREDSIEKCFPYHSPLVDSVVVVKDSGKKIGKAKLYHLRHEK